MYTAAVPLLNLVESKINLPIEQLVVGGTLARAAAGAGLRARYAEVAREVEMRASLYPVATAGALYNLAEGARLLEEVATRQFGIPRAPLRRSTRRGVAESRPCNATTVEPLAGNDLAPSAGDLDSR